MDSLQVRGPWRPPGGGAGQRAALMRQFSSRQSTILRMALHGVDTGHFCVLDTSSLVSTPGKTLPGTMPAGRQVRNHTNRSPCTAHLKSRPVTGQHPDSGTGPRLGVRSSSQCRVEEGGWSSCQRRGRGQCCVDLHKSPGVLWDA